MAKLLALLWLILGTAFSGGLMLVVLSMPSLSLGGLPYAAISGFGLAAPVAFWIARSVGPTGGSAGEAGEPLRRL